MQLGNFTIHFMQIIIFGGILSIIYLLVKWSQELTEKRFIVIIYFLISSTIRPLYSVVTESNGIQKLWFPLGFGFCMLYLLVNRNSRHSAKLKACFLGLTVAIYRLLTQYNVITF